MADYLGDHAVVLGGSVAGSLAARLLSDHYRQVTLIDRDTLIGPEDDSRRAVPQGHHIHALLARGQQILDELFTGFTDELASIGVPIGDFGTSLSWYFNGRMIQKAETGLICVAAGRPLLESRLRGRVRALPNVTYRERTDIVDLVAAPGRDRITGVRVQAHDAAEPEVLDADLVVDATGRGTRTPRWLEQLGYPSVPEERVKMELTYTTCHFHGPLNFDPIGDDIALLPVATPGMPRGAIFARLPDRYALSLTGILGEKPPTDMHGYLEYAKSLPVPEIYKALRDAEPMGAPAMFHFPASIRRRYERMSRLPDGLLAIGDAAAVFNPVYGQGMTVAAIGATVLGKHLAKGVPQPRAYFRDLSAIVDAPWDMAAGADLGFPGVVGKRTLKTRLGNSYIPRVQAAAASDGVLSAAFLRTAGLVDPPTALMKPSVMSRVFFGKR
ncbi:FAD-binding monooxygenase [Micromonospora maris]|uniref:FAD-binding monooxygenase n=1 Tax=Micromonospora maris TaxID=1003110 RepID=A0A9X0I3D6_9ACTN|nr:FAD-binding monooxygenase [Micromonospora maris]